MKFVCDEIFVIDAILILICFCIVVIEPSRHSNQWLSRTWCTKAKILWRDDPTIEMEIEITDKWTKIVKYDRHWSLYRGRRHPPRWKEYMEDYLMTANEKILTVQTPFMLGPSFQNLHHQQCCQNRLHIGQKGVQQAVFRFAMIWLVI